MLGLAGTAPNMPSLDVAVLGILSQEKRLDLEASLIKIRPFLWMAVCVSVGANGSSVGPLQTRFDVLLCDCVTLFAYIGIQLFIHPFVRSFSYKQS